MFNFKDISRHDILLPKDEIFSDICDFYDEHMVTDEATGIRHSKDMRIRTYIYDMPGILYLTAGCCNDMISYITEKFRYRKDLVVDYTINHRGNLEYWVFYVTPYIRIILSSNNEMMDGAISGYMTADSSDLEFLKHVNANRENPVTVRFDQYFGDYFLPHRAPYYLLAKESETLLENFAPYVLLNFFKRFSDQINTYYIANERHLLTYKSYPRKRNGRSKYKIIRINNELDYVAGNWSEIIFKNEFNISQHLFMVIAVALWDILGEYATFDEVNTLICRLQEGIFLKPSDLRDLLVKCGDRHHAKTQGKINYIETLAKYYEKEYNKISADLKRRHNAKHMAYVSEKHTKSNGKGGISW